MDQKYSFVNISDKPNSNIVALKYLSGDVLLIIAENMGQWEEEAIFITLSGLQWEAVKRLTPIESAITMASGL